MIDYIELLGGLAFFLGIFIFNLYTDIASLRKDMSYALFYIPVCFIAVIATTFSVLHGATVLLGLLLYVNILMILIFAILYRRFGIVECGTEATNPAPTDCLYLSIITWTTVGFGDLAPSRKSRPIAAAEALLGYFSMAFLIASFMKLLGG